MKPIQTTYNRDVFRSRLEAKWAVFFDALGIDYIYEPHELESEDGRRTYLPDFYIPNGIEGDGCFIEVKPIKPNNEYIEHIKSIYNPKLWTPKPIIIVVGNPTFYQPNGVYIDRHGTQKRGYSVFSQSGFSLEYCKKCCLYKYLMYYNEETGYLDAHFCLGVPNKNHTEAVEIASNYRFDL